MRQIQKSSKLNNVCYDIRGPIMDRANEMEAEGIKILKLNIGNPAPFGFIAPENITHSMRDNLSISEGYSDSKGILSSREAIKRYCNFKSIPNVSVNDIYTGNGVSELIMISVQALLDNGDEVLVPAPDYPLWTGAITLAGGNPVHYVCDEQAGWNPDISDIKNKITAKTKAIVIINPNNPTGALYSDDTLKEIVEVARQNSLIIFADEIYDRIIMDGGKHTAIASFAPDLLVVNLNGLSKSHRIAGYRSGWMCLSGDKSMAKGYIEGLNMLTSMRMCSNVPSQHVIESALSDPENYVDSDTLPDGRIFHQRQLVCDAIEKIDGLSAVKPKAAFYIFPKLDIKKFNITDDRKFVLDFLNDKKVLLVQGTGFNYPECDHFRIVLLPGEELLMDAVSRLADFLSYYKQK